MSREPLFRTFFLAVFALLLWQLVRVFLPFLPALLWATTFALVFYPVYPPLKRRLQADLAALAAAAIVIVGVLVPLGLAAYVLVRESAGVYPAARAWLVDLQASPADSMLPGPLRGFGDRLDAALRPAGFDLQGLVLSNLRAVNAAIAAAAAETAKQALLLVFNLVVMSFSLFFLFRHGEDLAVGIGALVPMARSHKKAIGRTVQETFTMLVRGVMAGAVVRGALAGVGFWCAGLGFPVFLGFGCAFASLIPFGGAALVWAPVVLKLFWSGQTAAGLFLLGWCVLLVSALDRFARPGLAGTRARPRLSALILFFSILGGLSVYGANGILLGPLLFASALACVRIYREEFSHLKPLL